MGSLRIAQAQDIRDFGVLDYTLSRNNVAVTTTGTIRVSYVAGFAVVAGRIVLTSVPASTGNWKLDIPGLLYPDQIFGTWNTATTSTPALLAANMVTPQAQPTMTNGSYMTIQGMVSA